MLIIFGTRLYGKVDEVPGLFHVATNFAHVWYLPLIPLGSHVVVERTSEGWQGVPIGLSIKSWLMTWLRAAMLLTGLGAAGWAVGLHLQGRSWWPAALVCGLALLSAAHLTFSAGYRRASYARAVELGEKVGLTDEGNAILELCYGKMSEEEAAKIIIASQAGRAERARRARERAREKKAARQPAAESEK